MVKPAEAVKLEEIRDRAEFAREHLQDPAVVQKYAERAAVDDVPALLALIDRNIGTPKDRLADVIREGIMEIALTKTAEPRARAAMLGHARVHSCSVTFADKSQAAVNTLNDVVIVDVRLMIGEEP